MALNKLRRLDQNSLGITLPKDDLRLEFRYRKYRNHGEPPLNTHGSESVTESDFLRR